MALSRVQLLMGNDQQGAVLPGEVQAVKQGAGILIGTDGTISVDSSTVAGLVKLNNLTAFNGYVWPNTKGAQGQVLTMGTGDNLTWTNGGVFVSGSAPLNPAIGDLWFNCTVGELLVYEACTSGSPKWTSGAAGLPVDPTNTSASPAFVSGSGTINNPYICVASSASIGGTVVVNRVTVTDLAPFQFVQVVDLNAVVNGGRFSVSNNVANASGILVFDLLFTDSPTSTVGTTYTCALKVGTGSVYINTPVTMTDVYVLNSPGTISGVPQVSLPLTYTPGTAAGGAPPYVYTWVWKRFGNNGILQNNGLTYTPPLGEFGNSVYVTLTAEDDQGQFVSGSTPDYGPISKPPFPNPTPPTIPVSIGVETCFTWDGASTTLESDNCLLFKVATGPYSQGPTPVTNGQTVCTKWSDAVPGVCGNSLSGTFIEGCLFDVSYSACSSLTLDRIPGAFTIDPEGDIIPGAVATSFPVTLSGFNAPTYLTLGTNNGTPGSYQVKVGEGSFVSLPPSGTSVSALPGDSVAVRFTTGSSPSTSYSMQLVAGDSTGNTSATFTATTGNSNFPTTNITFPTTTSGTGSVGVSAPWGNGTTSITATGCIEFSLNGGSSWGSGPETINNSNVLRTRFKAGASCADNAQGQSITGGITNNTFTESTTLQINRAPTSIPSLGNLTNESPSTQYSSNQVTPTGYNSTGYVTLAAGATLTGVQAAVGFNAFAPIPASGSTTMPINPGQTLQIRGTTGAAFTTTYSATVEVGVTGNLITQTWSVETGVAVPSVDTPSVILPSNGSTGVGTSAGITWTSSPFNSRDGAGTGHASSDWEVYAALEFPIETSPIASVSQTPVFGGGSTRSVRFISSRNSVLTRSVTTPGANRKKWTWSSWVKKSVLGSSQGIFVNGDVAQDQINLQLSDSNNKIVFTDQIANVVTANLVTTASLTNCSEWLHLTLAVDTTSIVSSQRIKLYVNGVQITAFDTAIYYPQNTDTTLNGTGDWCIGANGISRTNYLDSYLAQIDFVDGQTLLPTSFGSTSGTFWVPKTYTGTFGTAGFQLLFASQADPSSTTLGLDSSGNGLNFTPVNIDTRDSVTTSFDAPVPTTFDLLVVGGGGGNFGNLPDACNATGGGGGGAVQSVLTNPALAGKNYQVTIGGGGGKGDFSVPSGGTSRFQVYRSLGGNIATGSGGSGQGSPGNPGIPGMGGSGGPGSGTCVTGSGSRVGGGGGGAGGSSTDATGGPGVSSSISGSAVFYGGGGGGGSYNASGGDGRDGGGGGANSPGGSTPAAPNRGGGGGGNGRTASPVAEVVGGNSAAGVVIISYPSTDGAMRIGSSLSATPTSSGGRQIYTFTSGPSQIDSIGNVADNPTPAGVNTGEGNEVSGNYNTFDPERKGSSMVVSAGALRIAPGSNQFAAGTTPLVSQKYYFEFRALNTSATTLNILVGVSNEPVGSPTQADSYLFNAATGQIVGPSGSPSSYGNAAYGGDVVGVAFDGENGRLYFSLNSVWQNSGDPETSVNPAFASLPSGPYYVSVSGNSGQTMCFNFGQFPYVFDAPTGYGPLVDNPTVTTLIFDDDTNLTNMTNGDRVTESGGSANGVISGINAAANAMSIVYSTGTWTVGELVADLDVVLPAPAPTTEPPDPLKYILVDSVTGSTVDLTSYSVAKPPLDPFLTYYTRVKYTSNAPVVTSDWSPYNGVTAGPLV